ncbi:MAG: amino acid ABC transporter substrate-binding protein [Nitrospinota bacterium]
MADENRSARGWFAIVVTAVFALGVVLAALPADAAKKPVLIGVSIALSGKFSKSGGLTLRGYKMWQRDINAKGGLLGRKVQLKVYDDESNPTTGAKLMERLITFDKVDLIFGPFSSPVTYATSTVTEKYKFPMIAGGSSSSKPFSRGYKYLFQVMRVNNDSMLGNLLLLKQKGAKTLAIIHSASIYPSSLARGLKKLAKRFGLKLLSVDKYPPKTIDFTSLLIKVKALNPDALFLFGYYPDGLAISKQVKELDLNPRHLSVMLGAGYDEYGSKKGMGADSNYVGGYTGWEPFLKTKGNEEFVKKYFAQFKDDRFLDSHVIYGYISGQVLERAVNQSGSLNRDKIRDAIAKMKFQSFMPGHFEVDPKTGMQIGHQWASFQWQNGKKVIVYPKSDATGELLYPAPPWKSRK